MLTDIVLDARYLVDNKFFNGPIGISSGQEIRAYVLLMQMNGSKKYEGWTFEKDIIKDADGCIMAERVRDNRDLVKPCITEQ